MFLVATNIMGIQEDMLRFQAPYLTLFDESSMTLSLSE
jgi:hypothetical protein